MGSQYTLDVAGGDAIVIVTRAATLRVDCHKIDGDWSLLLQYRADSQPAGGRKDTSQWHPLEGQPKQAGALVNTGTPQGGRGNVSTSPTPSPASGQPAGYGEIRQADRFPGGWQPAKGVFGQMVPCGLLTVRETAKALRISERTLHTLTKSGEIQAVRFGRAVRYDPDVLKQWIEKQTKKTQG